jgi:ATP-dependent RNA helicase DDX56/DBP9
MSATMTDDVETLKGLALRNPVRPPRSLPASFELAFQVTLKLEEDEDGADNLTQYVVRYFFLWACTSLASLLHPKDDGS